METPEEFIRAADLLRNMTNRMESTGGHMLYKLPGNISPAEHAALLMAALCLEEKSWTLADAKKRGDS